MNACYGLAQPFEKEANQSAWLFVMYEGLVGPSGWTVEIYPMRFAGVERWGILLCPPLSFFLRQMREYLTAWFHQTLSIRCWTTKVCQLVSVFGITVL